VRSFEIFSAQDRGQAVALLAEYAPEVSVLAGGTDLLVELKHGTRAPRVVVDITRVHELRAIELNETGLSIGALATHSAIMGSPLVREHCPVLAEAAHTIGAMQTRNLGTLGGNLVTAVPSMDSGPALLALDAAATIAGPRGTREVPVAEFFLGPRKTVLRPDELLCAITVPRRNLGKPAAFLKFGLRKGQALALVNVAASMRVAAGRIAVPRIALGAVAPTLMRAVAAEKSLDDRVPSETLFAEAGRIAADEARPITDFRASAEYRRELIAVLTRRVLATAWARAEESRR
jgi:CO/xanthine dehydrogenase FAD-binding subunit